jgi:hypothetical protein
MKSISPLLHHSLLLWVAISILLCLRLSAQPVLMLDFGPTTPTGSNLTNSPYHTENPSVTVSTWNVVETADVSSGLLWGNGSAATGVTLNLGVSPNNNIIDFASQPSTSSALGTFLNSGIYDGTSVGKDGIFSGSGGQNNRIGLKVGGLALGTYDVFVVGINTNQGSNTVTANNTQRVMNMLALATTDVATLDTSSFSFTEVLNYNFSDPNNNTIFSASWVPGTNYAKFSVTLTEDNPILTIVSTSPIPNRGFLNAVQVVAIPEPQTLFYACSFGMVMLSLVTMRILRRHRLTGTNPL